MGRPAPAPELFEMPSPFLEHEGLVRLLEPPGSDGEALSERLIAGEYDKPFVLENDRRRYLYFSLRFIQSSMRLDEPDALDLAYTRKMMAFLLFKPWPERVLLLGLGGGSLAKFCYRYLPQAELVALEIDPHVLALRETFRVPPDDHRFKVLHGDGASYVAQPVAPSDVILVDTFDVGGVSPALARGDFFENAYRCLSSDGILVMNFAGDPLVYAPYVARLARQFEDRVIAISVRGDANYVVFAFKAPAFAPGGAWATAGEGGGGLKRRFGLDFARFKKQLERGHRLRFARRIAR